MPKYGPSSVVGKVAKSSEQLQEILQGGKRERDPSGCGDSEDLELKTSSRIECRAVRELEAAMECGKVIRSTSA